MNGIGSEEMRQKFVNLLKSFQIGFLISYMLICMGITAGQVSDIRGGIGLYVCLGGICAMWGMIWIIYKIDEWRKRDC